MPWSLYMECQAPYLHHGNAQQMLSTMFSSCVVTCYYLLLALQRNSCILVFCPAKTAAYLLSVQKQSHSSSLPRKSSACLCSFLPTGERRPAAVGSQAVRRSARAPARPGFENRDRARDDAQGRQPEPQAAGNQTAGEAGGPPPRCSRSSFGTDVVVMQAGRYVPS